MSSFDEKNVLDILEKASKSVVNISTIKHVNYIFYRVVPVKGMGSGTIIDPKGYILTNNHVVGEAEKISVTLWNGEILEGKLAGSCTVHDIAVVKVNREGLPAAELGDSDKLRFGQRVYAIGNPFGLSGGPTITSGVISAVNRTIESETEMLENLVQTDAAINPGNSGGPLVNLEGKVVAINTAIIPFAQGIGFAIPINSAKTCASEIVTSGVIARPWFGIIGLSITDDIARYYNLPVKQGVLVTRVVGGSPADEAGMAAGDLILKIDNVEIRSIEDLVEKLHKRRVGDKIQITAISEGKERSFEATLSKMP
ncbi:MAG TPA: trypsin-like peptidase domain-containing protein [Acidobacteriota bacterium]|nr:trypsin-like peptidase domain-containing protein [Acidobacteriota bacterium]